jgi:arylsulfatase A-like enzyme
MRSLLISAVLLSVDALLPNATQLPHIVSLMIDDLGHYDTQVHNPDAPTPTIGELVKQGINLERFYVYSYCSPTRRSFLAGRFPTLINANQANICDNFLPLQFTLLPQKLAKAGYKAHFIGGCV